MYTFLLFIFSSFFITFNVFSQSEHTFIGVIRTKDNDVFTYKLSFKVSDDNKIKGESITDFNGSDKTISSIDGVFYPKSDEIVFKETSVLKSYSKSNEFCLISVDKLKITSKEEKNIVQGKFHAKFPNGSKCTSGYLYLVNENKINQIKNKNLDSLITNFTTKNSILLNNLNNRSFLSWKSKSINLLIFDSSMDDNDIIDVYYNDVLVMSNYSIKKEKKSLKLDYLKGAKLKIIAKNVGSEGKNTVSILLLDNDTVIPVTTVLNKNEFVEIVFN